MGLENGLIVHVEPITIMRKCGESVSSWPSHQQVLARAVAEQDQIKVLLHTEVVMKKKSAQNPLRSKLPGSPRAQRVALHHGDNG